VVEDLSLRKETEENREGTPIPLSDGQIHFEWQTQYGSRLVSADD
jgi:hypothetical protein